MGKAARGKADACTALAESWIAASEDRSASRGSDQTHDVFWGKVLDEFSHRTPVEALRENRYHHRGINPIKNQWRDTVQRDSNTFNRAAATSSSDNDGNDEASTKRNKRGGGNGRKAAKVDAALNEHHAKKLKALEQIYELQQERHEQNKKMLFNQARFQAFMMARAGVEANRLADPDMADVYRKRMDVITGVESEEEDDEQVDEEDQDE